MHPTDEALIGWVLGEEGEAADEVRRHVAGPCPACAERAREIGELVTTMRSDRDPEPPTAWVRRAVSLHRRVGAVVGLLGRIRRWGGGLLEEAARLVADSGTPELAPAGLRSSEVSRRLRFETGDVELDVELEAVAGGVRLTGQFAILRPEPAPLADARYLLVAGGGVWRDGETDSLGEFDTRLDTRLDELADLHVRVIHRGRVIVFEVPEPRNPE